VYIRELVNEEMKHYQNGGGRGGHCAIKSLINSRKDERERQERRRKQENTKEK
jgi:hypothetical protein